MKLAMLLVTKCSYVSETLCSIVIKVLPTHLQKAGAAAIFKS